MRIFVTGGTGFIGSAVVPELTRAGHAVTVLLRTPAKAGLVNAMEARVHPGDLVDPDGYRAAAAEHDALVHIAFQYDERGVEADRTAIETLLEAAANAGAARQVVYTSGCWVLGDTGEEPVDEDAPTDHPAEVVAWRPGHERRVLDVAGGELRTAVIRPGLVYGGSGGLAAKMFESAEADGAAIVVGDGENHWSMVHRSDLARLYRLVVERREGGVFHGVDGEPAKVRSVAAAASEAAGAGGAIRTLPLARAREKIGAVADALALDQYVMPHRSLGIGWEPECPSFGDCADLAYQEWRRTRTV